MKNTGCIGCHQLGQESTRTIPKSLGTFASGAEAWKRRVQSGQSGQQMFNQLTNLGEVAFANYGDWTDRIAKGELPFAKPPRPQGVERNIVVTLRDWMNEKQYLHDLIASDRRFPTVNANGPLLRIAGIQLGHAADPRSGREHGDDVQGAGARSRDAAQPRPRPRGGTRCAAAVAVLGQRAHLGDARQQPQLDVRARWPACG